jgi:hypothetical protein
MKNSLNLRRVLFGGILLSGILTVLALTSFRNSSDMQTTAEVAIESIVMDTDLQEKGMDLSLEDCIEWCKNNPNCTPEECREYCKKYCGTSCDEGAEPSGDCCASACAKKC